MQFYSENNLLFSTTSSEKQFFQCRQRQTILEIVHGPLLLKCTPETFLYQQPFDFALKNQITKAAVHYISESDNLGSTDSEVKKILTLHLPISEYDTLGSDSEGDGRATSQELMSFSHRIRGKKHCYCSGYVIQRFQFLISKLMSVTSGIY